MSDAAAPVPRSALADEAGPGARLFENDEILDPGRDE